jgi:hypothetical protein
VQTTLTFLSIACLGAYLSLYPKDAPILEPKVCKKLGALTVRVFMPALTAYSLAANLSVSLFSEGAWVLVMWGVVQIAFNLAVAAVLCQLINPPR